MKVIITMAGNGSRFRKIGLEKPKHEIIANGKSLFHWSMCSLTHFFDHEFIFITREDYQSDQFIAHECEALGIQKFQIVKASGLTDGQASTVLLANACIDDASPLLIYNIDTYIEPNQLLPQHIQPHYDGYIPSFKATGDKWSFVATDSKEDLKVTEITEKVRISELGTIGLYHFKSWKDFKTIYNTHKRNIIDQYKETYIAPMYQYLIEQGKAIYTHIVDTNAVHVLGTPEDIEVFHPNYLEEN